MLFLSKGMMDTVKINDNVSQDTKVLLGVVFPWINNNRVAFADSHFYFIAFVELIYVNGSQFINVEKATTKKYPMTYLGNVEFGIRGDMFGIIRVK